MTQSARPESSKGVRVKALAGLALAKCVARTLTHPTLGNEIAMACGYFCARHSIAQKCAPKTVIHGTIRGYVSVQITVQTTHTPLHRYQAILSRFEAGGEFGDGLGLIAGGLVGGDDLEGEGHSCILRADSSPAAAVVGRRIFAG